jgi:branched-chain amino acid transport system ATP-binding protein
MAEDEDTGGLRLRVDRLAAAMEAARARARAEAESAGEQDGRAATSPVKADEDGAAKMVPQKPPTAPELPLPAPQRPVPPDQTAAPRGDRPGVAPTPAAPDSGEDAPSATDLNAVDTPEPVDRGSAHPAHSDAAARGGRPLLLTADFEAPDPGRSRARDMRDAEADLPPAIVVQAPPTPPRAPETAPGLLSLSGVATDIGGCHILRDVTFEVPRGGVTMLLGRNGAGTTTILRTILGLWRARAGEIRFAGDRIDRWPTHRIARAGIGYVPQSLSIFSDLTVAENIALGARSGPVPRDRIDWLTGLFPPLGTFWRSPAANLSGEQRQLLALARALVERRRLYLIDEPTRGLPPAIVDTVVSALRDLKLQGAAILLVEQNFAVARALGDACAVVDDGRIAWRGTMQALADDPALQARHLGLHLGDVA